MKTSFTILSTRAPLVEVDGDGPYYLLPGGTAVTDGARTIVPLDLCARSVRKFRVETSPTNRTAVIVGDSPFGAFAHVRRCVEPTPPKRWWRGLNANRWPRLTSFMQRHARSLLAVWFLLTDEAQPCHWHDIGDVTTNQVLARGGDIVVVSFVNAEGGHA